MKSEMLLEPLQVFALSNQSRGASSRCSSLLVPCCTAKLQAVWHAIKWHAKRIRHTPHACKPITHAPKKALQKPHMAGT